MKKNTFLRTAVVLLLIFTLTVSVFMGTGTTAKYVAAAVGEANARVAKFSIKYTGWTAVDTTGTKEIAVDPGKITKLDIGKTVGGQLVSAPGILPLFATRYVSHTQAYTDWAVGAGQVDLDGVPGYDSDTVYSSGAIDGISALVAPGTNNPGGFKLRFWNASEVAVKLTITAADLVTDGSIGSGTWTSLTTLKENSKVPIQLSKDGATWVAFGAFTTDPVYMPPNQSGASGQYVEVPVYWRWVFKEAPDSTNWPIGDAPSAGFVHDDVYKDGRGVGPANGAVSAALTALSGVDAGTDVITGLTALDAYDTMLGIKAQSPDTPVKVGLKLNFLFEQVD